jgi:hypothetical protein
LLSCNNNNPNVNSPTKTEKNISAAGSNRIDDIKKQKLSSILYGLATSPDTHNFAKKHHIFLDKDRVRVFIFFEPSAPDLTRKKILNDHGITIEKSAAELTRGRVPVDQLIPLSDESGIRSIRLPDKLIKARKINP